MAKIEPDLKKAGAVVYAISNEGAPELTKMKEREKLGDVFVFLSDKENKAADKYAGHEKGQTLLKSATFVIGRDGKIAYAYVGEDYRIRAGAQTVLDAVNKVAKEQKPSPP